MAWPEFQKGDSGSIRTDGWRVKRLDAEIRNDVGRGDGHNVMGISDTRKADYIIVGAQWKVRGASKGEIREFLFSLECGGKPKIKNR